MRLLAYYLLSCSLGFASWQLCGYLPAYENTQPASKTYNPKPLKTGDLTVKNSVSRPVTLRAYYQRLGKPFEDYQLAAGKKIKIPYYAEGNLIGIGVPTQTISLGTWQAVQKIIDPKSKKKNFTLEYTDNRWHVKDKK